MAPKSSARASRLSCRAPGGGGVHLHLLAGEVLRLDQGARPQRPRGDQEHRLGRGWRRLGHRGLGGAQADPGDAAEANQAKQEKAEEEGAEEHGAELQGRRVKKVPSAMATA
jgi:hypothetical protein